MGPQEVLVYNRDRSIQFQGDAGEDVKRFMRGRAKAFAYAVVEGGRVTLTGREAPPQPW